MVKILFFLVKNGQKGRHGCVKSEHVLSIQFKNLFDTLLKLFMKHPGTSLKPSGNCLKLLQTPLELASNSLKNTPETPIRENILSPPKKDEKKC